MHVGHVSGVAEVAVNKTIQQFFLHLWGYKCGNDQKAWNYVSDVMNVVSYIGGFD